LRYNDNFIEKEGTIKLAGFDALL